MRDNKVNVLKRMLGMLLVAPVMLSLSLFAVDPVHLWELDENGTTTYVDFYNEANGTCAAGRCPTPSVGIINGAQDFNGSDPDLLGQRIDIDVSNTTNFEWGQNANITIAFWMNADTCPSGNRVMIGRASSGKILWYIGVDGTGSPGNIRVAVSQDKTDPANAYDRDSGSDENVTDGAWHHIAVVLTEPEIKVYVDGNFDFNVSRNAISDLNVSSDVNIGSMNTNNDLGYTGKLDDIALYNVALSASEIKAIYDSIVSPPAPEPEPEPEPEPDTTLPTSDGGGCTYNPDSKNFDMVFLLMIALGLFYPVRRRFIK